MNKKNEKKLMDNNAITQATKNVGVENKLTDEEIRIIQKSMENKNSSNSLLQSIVDHYQIMEDTNGRTKCKK